MTQIRLHRATQMDASEPVTWRLAPGNLAAGRVNLLVGDEGIGKSLWTIRAMSAISTGKPWGPFTIADHAAEVILIATEDGWSDTIRPRLERVWSSD
jgi:RecA-family ATPase